jgi:nucleoside-diphosphate-sugar epimerase
MKSLSGKSILVTGATGFVGSRLAELLATKEKAEVTGIGRTLDRVSHLKKKGVTLEAVDILDTEALKRVVEGKDFIYHAAAVLDADPDTAQSVNVDATEHLVRLVGQMSTQLNLTNKQLLDLIDCPMSKKDFVENLKSRGIIS